LKKSIWHRNFSAFLALGRQCGQKRKKTMRNCVFQDSAGVLSLSGLGRGGRVLCQKIDPKMTFLQLPYC